MELHGQGFGIHFFWDGDPWKRMMVRDEDGRVVLDVQAQRNVRKQGLTEGFFESAEPPISELSMEEFLARFPEQEYEFRGTTLEGGRLEGTAEFTHTLPAPPTDLSPATGDVVSHQGFIASFTGVTQDVEGNDLDIAFYEVVVEKLEEEPLLQVFTVILRPTRTSVFVPAQFLEPNTQYKLEVIAEEESGNRTITETEAFTTTPGRSPRRGRLRGGCRGGRRGSAAPAAEPRLILDDAPRAPGADGVRGAARAAGGCGERQYRSIDGPLRVSGTGRPSPPRRGPVVSPSSASAEARGEEVDEHAHLG